MSGGTYTLVVAGWHEPRNPPPKVKIKTVESNLEKATTNSKVPILELTEPNRIAGYLMMD